MYKYSEEDEEEEGNKSEGKDTPPRSVSFAEATRSDETVASTSNGNDLCLNENASTSNDCTQSSNESPPHYEDIISGHIIQQDNEERGSLSNAPGERTDPDGSSSQTEVIPNSRDVGRTPVSTVTVPMIEIPRRLSLQVNNAGNPVRQIHGIDSDGNILALNSLWNVLPPDGYRDIHKLPGGSRYFVNPIDESMRRTTSATPSVNYLEQLSIQTPSAFPWHEERLSTSGSLTSERPPSSVNRPPSSTMNRIPSSAQNRPPSTSRNRPLSTACQPRITGLQHSSSPKYSWPSPMQQNAYVFHLPPGGPDCHPGCGYSGLPCYVCSTKVLHIPPVNPEGQTRPSIFSILHRREDQTEIHRSRGQQTTGPPYSSDSFSFIEMVFKPCFYNVYSCFKSIGGKLHLPHSRLKQLGLTCFIIYILLILHIGITRILRDYHF